MDKANPPLTFGVFKPTGHTLMAFQTREALQDAMRQIAALGFEGASMIQYDAQEMSRQIHDELAHASPLSRFGYEVDLSRQHLRLAEQGCSFLLVHAPDTKHASQIAGLVEKLQPATAQHYGRFLIEDLTEHRPGL